MIILNTLQIIFNVVICLAGVGAKGIYDELNMKIERMCNWVHLVFVDASLAGFLLPAVILTNVNYFIHDMEEESFTLPTPVM